MGVMSRPPAPRMTSRAEREASSKLASTVGDSGAADDQEWVDQPEIDDDDLDSYEIEAVSDSEFETRELETIEISLGGTSEHSSGRVLEPEEPGDSHRWLVLGEALRGARAGLEAIVLSWLLVVVPVIAAYIATVASPLLGESSWLDAARNGSTAWLLGFGQPLAITSASGAPAAVTLVPLGLTLLTGWLLVGSVRRAALQTPLGAIATAATASLGIAGSYAFTGESVSGRMVVITLPLLSVAIAWGMVRSGAITRSSGSGLFASALEGAETAVRCVLALLALGAIAVIALVILRASDVAELHRALQPNLISTVVLIVAQVLALPTLAVWAMAWWLGPGFTIGLVEVAPGQVSQGPLPVIPILAALPDGNGSAVGSIAVVIVPILVIAVIAMRSLRGRTVNARDLAVRFGVATLVLALLGGGLAYLSGGLSAGGSVGPLAAVGTSAVAVGLSLLWVGAVGFLVAVGARLGLMRLGISWNEPQAASRMKGPGGFRGALSSVSGALRGSRDTVSRSWQRIRTHR